MTIVIAEPIASHGGVRNVSKQGSHDYLANDRGSDYIAARIKRDYPEMVPAIERGRPKKGDEKGYNVIISNRNSPEAKLAALKRDNPDLADRVIAR